MIRVARLLVAGVVLIPVVITSAILLFWLGRARDTYRGELVVDPEDDPGTDIDEDERTP